MKKFVLRKGDHTFYTTSPTERVTYIARGYELVEPEPVKAKAPNTKSKTNTEALEAKESNEK